MSAITTSVRAANRSADDFVRLGEFATYPEAAKMLHRLDEGGFPILRARIISRLPGSGNHSSRPAAGRAALIGAGLGAWLGVITALVLFVVVPGPAWPAVLLGAPFIAAAAGGVLGLIIHWGTGSARADAAANHDRYAVEVETGDAPAATRALEHRAARETYELAG